MKIAFLSYYSGKVNRGVETFVAELTKRLITLGHEVTIYTSLSSFLRHANNPDVLFPTNGRLQVLLSKLWCLIHGKKLVISGQSGLGIDDRFNLWLFPDVFVALTNFQAQWAKAANPFAKIAVIPNGAEIPDKAKPRVADLPKPIILCVSALTKAKRPELAIQAVAKMKSGSLLLVGAGERHQELEVLGQKLLPARFKIISVPYQEINSVYASADLFTFSSVPWESFGIVLVEAMAANLPVVCSDDPIRREIVGDAGIFVNPENTDEYAKALETALNKNWGDVPRRQAEKFSWDIVAHKYEDLFKSL